MAERGAEEVRNGYSSTFGLTLCYGMTASFVMPLAVPRCHFQLDAIPGAVIRTWDPPGLHQLPEVGSAS